jgi:putative membrane protein
MKDFSDEIRQKIREKVQVVEKESSVEFVPYVAQKSHDYFFFRAFSSLLFIVCAWFVFSAISFFQSSDWFLLGAVMGAGVLFWPLSGSSIYTRFLVPRRLKMAEVEEGARLTFLREEVFATKKRTGILIYISLLERAVYVLADRGITDVLGEEPLGRLGQSLAADFSSGASAGDTFLKALRLLSNELKQYFPRDSVDLNELPDSLRHE